jgi:hypothetical protein
MNKLLEYLELELQRQQTPEDDDPASPYETLLGKMDRLWYYELSDKQRHLINTTYRNRGSVDYKTTTEQMIDKLKGNQIMSNIFNTKEEYLALRNFWKNYHAEGRHKAVSTPYYTREKTPVGFHKVSELNRDAHLIYLAAIGKPLDKAFGNASPETLADMTFQFSVSYYLNKFNIFEGNISPQYFGAIKARILDYLAEKKKGA